MMEDLSRDLGVSVSGFHHHFKSVPSIKTPLLFTEDAPPAGAPHPEWADEATVRRGLRGSASRVSLRRLLFS